MATRGSMGGLAVHTAQVCDVLDAAGFSRVLIETVGVGQSELEVAQTADSTAVVLVPESGDTVQAMKAGLMEIGDLFVINKADREGAERAVFAIRSALELRVPATGLVGGAADRGWDAPVLLTTAVEGQGIEEVLESFERHLEHLERQGGLETRRRQRLEQRLAELLRAQMWQDFRARVSAAAWQEALAGLAERRWTPHQAARRLAEALAAAEPHARPAHLDASAVAPITTTPSIRAAR
jgi:LAO/AO transport system kinase